MISVNPYWAKRLTGTSLMVPELAARSVEFRRRMDSLEFQVYGKHIGALFELGNFLVPKRVRDGAGALWMEVFSDYAGDVCLQYPFVTAATVRGTATAPKEAAEAHRIMCRIVNGDPTDEKPMALHRCGNGHLGCVTPKHLYWGDASDNAKDTVRHAAEGKPQMHLPKPFNRRRPEIGREYLRDPVAYETSRIAAAR